MFENTPPSPALVIVRRELLLLARNGKLYYLLGAFVALLLMMAGGTASVASEAGRLANGFGPAVFRTQFLLLYVTAIVVVPMLGASAIIHERRQDCYPLLYLTLIPPVWIVRSKFLAIVGLFLGLYIGVLPFIGLVYFFSGLETVAMFQAALVLVSIAACTAGIGLAASARSGDYSTAQSHTASFVFLLIVLPLLARLGFVALTGTAPDWLIWMGHGTAFAPLGLLPSPWTPLLVFAGFHLAIASLGLALAHRGVVPRRTRRERSAGRIPRIRRRWRFVPIPDGANPVAVKDIRGNVFSRSWYPAVLGMFGIATGVGAQWIQAGMAPHGFALEGVLLFFMVPSLVATLVTMEREENMIAELGLTPLTGSDLVCGKYIAVWRLLRPLLAGALVGRIVFLATALSQIWLWQLVRADWDDHLIAIVAGTIETLLSFGCMTVFAVHVTSTRGNTTFASLSGMFLIGMFWILATMLASVPTSGFGAAGWRNPLVQVLTYDIIKFGVLTILAVMLRLSTVRIYQEELHPRR